MRETERLVTVLSWAALTITASCSTGAVDIRLVSSRPDMVTGGDALVEISGAGSDSLDVRLNGNEVSKHFRPAGQSDKLVGRVEGLRLGENVLTVKSAGNSGTLKLVNHPLAGPVFSGPHQVPFVCEGERAGLGTPLDADCSVETRFEHYYKSTEPLPQGYRPDPELRIPRQFKAFDPSAPRPPDLARTTTSLGTTVDFIIRLETGTINRAIYQIAFLHDPGSPLPDPWTAGESWNGRLVYKFGGGCRAGYRQGRLRSVLLDDASLSLGFAVAASSLNVFGNNCDDVVSAETMMMVKERFIESFGKPLHTIGSGGSGGSMQQHLIAQNYPGLLDGIIPGASYPDIVTLVPPVTDCSLLARAFENGRLDWTEEQKTAVSGFATWKTCESWMRSFSPAWIRPDSCAPEIPSDQVYDAERNPDGVRCGLHDNLVNLFGREPSTGLARRALDNVGVQYGLKAFNAGRISAEQFLKLNETIGGYDADGNLVAMRSVADSDALAIAYRNGRVNSGAGSLGSIPIVDSRRYADPTGNIHDRVRTFATEARLLRANGATANRVVLTDAAREVNTIDLMDRWLTNISEDTEPGSASDRVARTKPEGLDDSCWTADGERVGERASYDDAGRCNQLYASHSDPRMAAGAPLANDILKCAFRPVNPADYQRALTADQLDRLRKAFPEGVCDYSRPGIGQEPLAGTWLSYSATQ